MKPLAAVVRKEEAFLPNRTDENGADIAADLAALREDIGRLSDTLVSVVRNQADVANEAIRTAVDDAKNQLSQAISSTRAGAYGKPVDLERRIERNPLVAVLIAAGVGLAFGVMSRPR